LQACGGHGYLEASGLPELHNTYLANCTLEGDNYMISQQTTRHLLKCLQRAREGSPVGGGESNPTISDSNPNPITPTQIPTLALTLALALALTLALTRWAASAPTLVRRQRSPARAARPTNPNPSPQP
jgi:hypothetical protein